MNEISSLAFVLLLALVAGMLLGAIFFGGLWWTVRNGLTAHRPALWFICSMMLRIGIVMIGFHFLLSLSGNSWEPLLGGVLGFILARLSATRLLPAPLSKIIPAAERSLEKPSLNQRGKRAQRAQRAERVEGTEEASHAP